MDQEYQYRREELDKLWLKYKRLYSELFSRRPDEYRCTRISSQNKQVVLKNNKPYPCNERELVIGYVDDYITTVSRNMYNNREKLRSLFNYIGYVVRYDPYCDVTIADVDSSKAKDIMTHVKIVNN